MAEERMITMVCLGGSDRGFDRFFPELVFSRYGLAFALILAAAVYGLMKLFQHYGTAVGLMTICIAAAVVVLGTFAVQRLLQNSKWLDEVDK